ncbi:DUF6264 family protein [Renibacterium salmoninarum]|nr:DUF6264 family protein [Renibacterium salmoninarum]
MSTPPQQPQVPESHEPESQRPAAEDSGTTAATPSVRGHYAEIAPGVPKYGQYAPEGFVPPNQQQVSSQQQVPAQQPSQAAPFNQPNYTPQAGQFNQSSAPTGYPNYPQPNAQPKVAPRLVQRAFVMILLAGVIQFAAALFAVLNISQLRDIAKQTMVQYGESGLGDSVVNMAIAFSFVFYAISIGLYIWIAVKIRAGRNWARVLGTVMAVLSLLMLISLSPLSIVQVALGAIGIGYCWMAASSEYFKR